MPEELDRHFLWFPPEGSPVWRVVKSEEWLAEEWLARKVENVNRSESRARTAPAPVCREPERVSDWSLGKRVAAVNRRLKQRQLSLLPPDPDVGVDGKRVR